MGRGVWLSLAPVSRLPAISAIRCSLPIATPTTMRRPRTDEADGHGHGGHAGMSMAAIVADMRNRFMVSLIFTIPIVL